MDDSFYKGDSRLNYCVKCAIDYEQIKEFGIITNCSNCGAKLRNKHTGLALSGGGFRAVLFHIGSLWRLNELGWLKRIAEVTSVSGGSITAAYLGLRWNHLHFEGNGVASNYVNEIVPPVRALC